MKLLSITIPCYNSQDYMEKCIESLLVGGEEVEILVVDDGSSDRTAEIADAYAEKYPTIVKAIHQENGGHGEAVNAGIRNATGLYFKVVDSDDWVDEEALKKILKVLMKRFLVRKTSLPFLVMPIRSAPSSAPRVVVEMVTMVEVVLLLLLPHP